MNRMGITSVMLNDARICESLKKGYATIFPDAHLSFDEHEIEHHPRIQACIQLLRTGINALPFHGYDSLESVNKIFCDHFLDTRNIHFQQCREQLFYLQDTPQFYAGIGRVGRILDEYQLGGSRMIRAACLARSHTVDESNFAKEIQEAISNFKRLRMVHDLIEIAEQKHGKWIIKISGIPSYYHLQVLAFTKSWRDVATTTIVSDGIRRFFELQIPSFYLKHKAQIIAPANVGLEKILNPQNAHDILWWFEIVKLLLMIGYNSPDFLVQIRTKLDQFEARHITHNYHFMKWGAYSGLALEPNWRSAARKEYDLYYRVQEIESLANSVT